jgi:hypothetical protein
MPGLPLYADDRDIRYLHSRPPELQRFSHRARLLLGRIDRGATDYRRILPERGRHVSAEGGSDGRTGQGVSTAVRGRIGMGERRTRARRILSRESTRAGTSRGTVSIVIGRPCAARGLSTYKPFFPELTSIVHERFCCNRGFPATTISSRWPQTSPPRVDRRGARRSGPAASPTRRRAQTWRSLFFAPCAPRRTVSSTPRSGTAGSPTRRRPQTCRALFGAAWTSLGDSTISRRSVMNNAG